ncbi:MAG: Ig-like domain-containing protein, partial [Bryobacterales bacterium]|nr:Ig-like domain-containing protein [Bryobacterales bacterium]
PEPATAAVMTPNGTELAVAAGALHIFDTSTDTEVVPNGLTIAAVNIFDVAVSLDGASFYTLGTASTGSELSLIDISLNKVTATLGISGTATGMTVGPNGLIYVSTVNEVLEINPLTFAATPAGAISVNGLPGPVVVTPDAAYAMAINQTPATGSEVILISLLNHAVVNTIPESTGVLLNSLLATGVNTALGYSSATQNVYQLTITNSGAGFNVAPFPVPNGTGATTALAVSNEVPNATRSTVQSAFAVANGNVEQLNPTTGQLQGEAPLPPGDNETALSLAGAATTGNPIILLQYGNLQTIAPNATSLPIVVQVLDTNSKPLFGATVRFTTSLQGSTLSATSVTTGANGYALTYLTAGSATGPVQVTATAGAQVVQFNLTVAVPTQSTANQLTIVAGQGQLVPEENNDSVGMYGSPFQVLISDMNGQPVQNVAVNFVITVGYGTLLTSGVGNTSVTVNTNSSGIASVDFLSPLVQGADAVRGYTQTSITVSAPNTNSVIFYITTYPIGGQPTPTLIQPQLGVLTAQEGVTLPGAVVIIIGSTTGYPIPNVGLTLSNGDQSPALFPSATCASVNGNSVLSDGNGVMTCDLIAGPRIGTVKITPVVGLVRDLSPFTLQVIAGPPAVVQIQQGNNQTGGPGETLPLALLVQLTDSGGNILIGQPVTWQVTPAGMVTLSQVSSLTDSNGRASALATLGGVGGSAQVTVTAGSITATFNLSINIPSAAIQKISGDTQTTVISTPFASPLVVQVVDANKNGVSGAQVTFQVTSGTATLGSQSAITNSSGNASTTVQAGASAGAITITATSSTFSVTFNLTAVLPGPTNITIVNGASFDPNTGISPGGIATLTGNGILNGVQGLVIASPVAGLLPTSLGGASVTFNGVPAPIYYVENANGVQQMSVQVPFEALPAGASAPANVNVVINAAGGESAIVTVQVKPFAPGVFFTLIGNQKIPVAVRSDGSYISPTNPAQLGEDISVFATGLGQVTPSASTGSAGIAGQTVTAPLLVGLSNSGVPIVSATYAQGTAGVYVITFHVPANSPTGPAEPFALVAYDSQSHTYFSQSISMPVQ